MMDQQPPTPIQEQTPPEPPVESTPITLRDVLGALFAPQETGAQIDSTPLIPALRLPALPRYGAAAPAEAGEHDEVSPGRMLAAGVGTIGVLLVAYLAQSTLARGGAPGLAATLYTLAGMGWLALLLTVYMPLLARGAVAAPPEREAAPRGSALAYGRIAALAFALPLSVATYILTANNTFTPAGVIAWLLSTGLWMIGLAERPPHALVRDWGAWLWRAPGTIRERVKIKPAPAIAFVAIMLIAVFFRFYRLDAVPVEMTSDHVEKLLDSYDVSQGIYHVFFTRNGGREAIQFYLVALAANLFGTGMSFMTLKLVSVLEGLALIPVVVALGRELVDRETGLLAAALVAMSWWHVVLSRLALRIVLTPFVFGLVLITLIRAVRTGSRRAWLWTGFWLGIGVYAYQAMRLAPLVAVAAFLIAVGAGLAHRKLGPATDAARQALNLACAGLIALVLFVPMLRVWHDYPSEMWNRIINRTTSSEQTIEGSPAAVFVDNYRDALGMFNVRGDAAWISAIPGKPVLDRVTAALFVLGVIAWAVRIIVRQRPEDVLMIAAGLIMLLPSALAIAFPIENPSTTRASAMLPLAYILAAWPLALIRQRWAGVFGRVGGSTLAGVLIAALLAGSMGLNFTAYFHEYDTSYRGAALNPSEVAAAVRGVIGPDAPMDGVWLQGWPHWHDYRAIGIEAGDITFSNALVDVTMLRSYLLGYPDRFAVRPLVFILHPEDDEALDLLRQYFPQGELTTYGSQLPGREFRLFVVREE
jgi:hypothetical protein